MKKLFFVANPLREKRFRMCLKVEVFLFYSLFSQKHTEVFLQKIKIEKDALYRASLRKCDDQEVYRFNSLPVVFWLPTRNTYTKFVRLLRGTLYSFTSTLPASTWP